MNKNDKKIIGTVALVILLLILITGFSMWFFPVYNVWDQGMEGKAKLFHADYERQVQVVNAQANLQAQKYNADAEVIRAGGVSKANNIIKNSISDQYIKYLWVNTLEKGSDHQIIYVPTEMGLPITEAQRLQK